MLVNTLEILKLEYGEWISLLKIPSNEVERDSEGVQEAIKELTNLLYAGEKLHLETPGESLVLRGIHNESSCFKIKAVLI